MEELSKVLILSVTCNFLCGKVFASSFEQLSNQQLEENLYTAEVDKFSDLEKVLVDRLQKNQKSVLLHYLLSQLAAQSFVEDPGNMQMIRQASDLAQQAIDLDPSSDLGYVALAQILDIMGQPDKSLEVLQTAERGQVTLSWRVDLLRARLLIEKESPVIVANYFRRSLAAKNCIKSAIIPHVIAFLQATAKDFELVKLLENWNEDFPSEYFQMSIAQEYAKLRMFEKSSRLFATIQKTNPDIYEASLNEAIILYRHLNRTPQADGILQKISAKSDHFSDDKKTVFYMHWAAISLKQDKYKVASEKFLKALDIAPDYESVLTFAAREYDTHRNPKLLEEFLRAAKEKVPGSAMIYGIHGEILYQMGLQDDRAFEEYTNAIVLDSKRSEFYNGRGLTAFRMKMYDVAAEDFSVATKIDPSDASSHYNLACALTRLDRGDEALNTLSEAIQIDPKLAQSAMKDRDLDILRKRDDFKKIIEASVLVH